MIEKKIGTGSYTLKVRLTRLILNTITMHGPTKESKNYVAAAMTTTEMKEKSQRYAKRRPLNTTLRSSKKQSKNSRINDESYQ